MEPIFFENPQELRDWLAAHHKTETEMWVGYYKKATGLPTITWSESVDQALCFGWIDGLRKSIDEKSYKIRFTPRKPSSHWSDVNLKKMDELIKADLVMPAGLEIYKKRKKGHARKAAHEQTKVTLDKEYENQLKDNTKAWAFFNSLPPSTQKTCIHWVMSAKQEKTRLTRLNTLIESSEKNEKIPPLKWAK